MTQPQNSIVPCRTCGSPCLARSGRCRACACKQRVRRPRDPLIGPNPSGLCMCGCGKPAPIATDSHRGRRRGLPCRFIRGHCGRGVHKHPYTVNDETGCWEWHGAADGRYGYGHVQRNGRTVPAHKWLYEQKYGKVPPGLVLDHFACDNPRCVNPDHVRPTTTVLNVQRSRNVRLNPEQVLDILSRWPAESTYTLGREYGVSYRTIFAIIAGLAWRNIDLRPDQLRVVFLDIDGVLNSEDWYWRGGTGFPALDPAAIARLDRICRETGAVVVLSSAWRGDDRIPGWLAERGFTGRIIDQTPRFPDCQRGYEILQWFKAKPRNVGRFVVLDDDDDLYHVRRRLIRTDWRTGLLDEHADRAIAMLR
jgi:hypothetical protein